MNPTVTADFETTTRTDDCRVWAWAVCDASDGETCAYGKNIQSFFRYIIAQEVKTAWFHNLGFDGKFIVDFMLRSGYSWVKDAPKAGEFTTLVSSKGKFYSIECVMGSGYRVKFYDSLKLFPMSIKKIAERFKLPFVKGELDYDEYRPVGHEITDEELDYILRDVKIAARALQVNIASGMLKMTLGANAMDWFKKDFGKKRFKKCFPSLSLDADAFVRDAYRGGFTYAEPKWKEKPTGPGISVDYNSMYPSVMKKYPYPVGEPIEFPGRYEQDEAAPLYVQRMTVLFSLKTGGIPCLQLRGMGFYGQHEYVSETVEPVQITVTNVDLEVMEKMYDIDVISYDGGMKFSQAFGLFDSYIDHWGAIKEAAEGGEREQAKLMLNNLYGKFGTNPDVTGKYPYMDDDGVVRWALQEQELREPVYIPVAVFCTAYARRELLFAIMENRERFAYCDTDSMHLVGTEEPRGIVIHEKHLCAWKVEYAFDDAFHLRAKAYIVKKGDALEVTCAGMPEEVKALVTWDNFRYGFSNAELVDGEQRIIPGYGKLVPKACPGGIVLVDSLYTLHA